LTPYQTGYDVHPASIVDVWLSFEEVDAVVAAGNNVVISYGLCKSRNPLRTKNLRKAPL